MISNVFLDFVYYWSQMTTHLRCFALPLCLKYSAFLIRPNIRSTDLIRLPNVFLNFTAVKLFTENYWIKNLSNLLKRIDIQRRMTRYYLCHCESKQYWVKMLPIWALGRNEMIKNGIKLLSAENWSLEIANRNTWNIVYPSWIKWHETKL